MCECLPMHMCDFCVPVPVNACVGVLCLTTCQRAACSVTVWPFVTCMRNEVRGGLGQRSDKVDNLLLCCDCHPSWPLFYSYCEQVHYVMQGTNLLFLCFKEQFDILENSLAQILETANLALSETK